MQQESKATEENKEREQEVLEAAKAYRKQTGNAGYIVVQELEQSLHAGEGALQAELEQLEIHQKIEVLGKSEQGEFLVIGLTHWAIRNSSV